jgi:hypothetical protein
MIPERHIDEYKNAKAELIKNGFKVEYDDISDFYERNSESLSQRVVDQRNAIIFHLIEETGLMDDDLITGISTRLDSSTSYWMVLRILNG